VKAFVRNARSIGTNQRWIVQFEILTELERLNVECHDELKRVWLFCGEIHRIHRHVEARGNALKPDQWKPLVHGFPHGPIVRAIEVAGVRGIRKAPFVAKVAIWPFRVVIGTLGRLPRKYGPKTECGAQLAGFPYSGLRRHEPEGLSFKAEGGEILLTDQRCASPLAESAQKEESGRSESVLCILIKYRHGRTLLKNATYGFRRSDTPRPRFKRFEVHHPVVLLT
jgi:hypothetical protein